MIAAISIIRFVIPKFIPIKINNDKSRLQGIFAKYFPNLVGFNCFP